MRASCKPTGRPTRVAAAAAPVDATSLAVLRIALGAVGVLSAVRIVGYGWVDALYAGPRHRFTYLGFGWVPKPGQLGMTVLVVGLGVASAALAVGWHTRLAALGVLVALGWIELIDVTTYLNHYWFLTLVAALMVVAPVGRAWSLDARRAGGATTIARGWVWLLRFQVAVVYAFAGVAKLQADWLVHALPLRLWLPARAHLPVIGSLLAEPATAHVLSIAGAAFDCTIVGLLLWRRTRRPAWVVLVAFHVCTWALFPIGVFPWVMIAASTVFFAPEWPRVLLARARSRSGPPPVLTAVPRPGRTPSPRAQRVARAGAAAWVVVQLALPLRFLAYPGDHRWTDQGYRFAWNVLLTEKAGTVTFLVRDVASGRTWVADPTALYTPNQLRVMGSDPDLIHQAALLIAHQEAAEGHRVEVRVDAWMSFDGRPPARLIDPTVDLAAVPRTLAPARWILPGP